MVTLDSLKYRHAEHRNNAAYWQLLEATIEGGDKVSDSIKRELLPNPDGRPEAVIRERIKLATFINKISPILNRFNSELFSRPGIPTGSNDPWWKEKFFAMGGLLDDDDDARANFNNYLQRSMHNALATGKAIAQIDTRVSAYPNNKGTQQRIGELDPYVILHPRTALWDWDNSSEGFNFVKLQQFRLVRENWENSPIPEHIFTIYFRNGSRVLVSKYRVRLRNNKEKLVTPFIERVEEKDIVIIPDNANGVSLENQEIFNIGGYFKFPVVTLTLPTPLWMGSQLFECQKSYFRQTAAIEYALYTGNYGILTINNVEDETEDPLAGRQIGDGYYLCLKEGQSINWLERSGGTVTTAINYRAEIKRDIYDTLQQIAMSAADGASILSRSGESKKEDRRPEEILLLKYGELVKEYSKNILDCASVARGERVEWEVKGYDDFLTAGLTDVLADYAGIATANIQSQTFKKELQKHLITQAAKAMDMNPDAVQKSIDEIDQAKNISLLPEAQEASPVNMNGNGL
jgi:hypothetical protein